MAEILVDIEVTEHDIRHGRAQHCSECPVALAITRKVKSALPVIVNYRQASLTDPKTSTHFIFPLPIEVTNWIKEYDYCGDVGPFSFSLFLPEEFVNG